MVRNSLELACNSLFIKKIINAFKAIGLPIVHDTDAIIIANELFSHSLWLSLLKLFEIKNKTDLKIANKQSDLNFPFVLRVNTVYHYHRNIHALLGGNHCQRHLGSF
jgi:hypothetical protein